MSAILMAVALLSVTHPDGTPVGEPVQVSSQNYPQDKSLPMAAGRKGAELSKAAHESLRRWARASDKEASQAAREFLVVYNELQADDQLARGERDQLRNKVRGRLINLIPQINKRTAIEKRLAKNDKDAPPAIKAPEGRQGVMAQWGPGGGMMMGPGMAPGMAGMAPGMVPGGGPVKDDDGDALVDLIQKTISPHTWDVNGGPGSIYYWRPGRAMVVSAPGEVHGQIGDLLEQMGKANR